MRKSKLEQFKPEIKRCLDANVPAMDIARALGVNPNTLYGYIRVMDLPPAKETSEQRKALERLASRVG
jgi:transposase-like protein